MELQAPRGQASCSMYEPWEGQPCGTLQTTVWPKDNPGEGGGRPLVSLR